MSRFNVAMLEILDLNHSVVMNVLKNGLRPSRFLLSIEKKFPKDLAELLSQADKYVNVEEEWQLGKRRMKINPRKGEGLGKEK